jgi:hypothetical protein
MFPSLQLKKGGCMNKRREFLKGAGIIGAFAGAAVGAKIVINEKEKLNKKAVEEIEKISPSVLSIQTTYGEIDNTPIPDGSCIIGIPGQKKFVSGTEKQVNVKFIPGPDGELYIHTNGQWKKVITT